MYFLVYAVEVWKSVHNTILHDAIVSSLYILLKEVCFLHISDLGIFREGGGTLGISGWECAAGTLEPLGYTRASSAEF